MNKKSVNKKIFFELDSFELDVFKDKLKDIKISIKESYCVDIYKIRVSSQEIERLSTIPFILLGSDKRDKLIEELFNKIYNNVSYGRLGSYYGNMLYEEKFYICIHKNIMI
jgi:hypothetical protein